MKDVRFVYCIKRDFYILRNTFFKKYWINDIDHVHASGTKPFSVIPRIEKNILKNDSKIMSNKLNRKGWCNELTKVLFNQLIRLLLKQYE